MWSITHTSPTRPAVFGSRQRRVRPLYIETCCLPRIDSQETQETPVWPTHDVTGMCVSEFRTHPLSSWHPFTIIIAQPQPSLCDPCRRSCLAVAVFSRGPGPELRLCLLRVLGPSREAGLPAGCSQSLAFHLHRASCAARFSGLSYAPDSG